MNFKHYALRAIKKVDFEYWCILVYMHKFGYFYLPKGRKIAVDTCNYINKSRYSNRNNSVINPELDISFLTMKLIMQLPCTMSHTKFAQVFNKLINPTHSLRLCR